MANFRTESVKFFFTMNMQSRSGNPTHQIIGQVTGVETLQGLQELVQEVDFIVVEEFYKRPEGGYYTRGDILLNVAHIGKVKIDA